jgi:hypothetical protein
MLRLNSLKSLLSTNGSRHPLRAIPPFSACRGHPRYAMLAKIPARDTQTVVTALIRLARKLPNQLYRSLTWDRGKELADHKRLTLETCIDVYFCHPQSPWRGSSENINCLLRPYLPHRARSDTSLPSRAEQGGAPAQRAAEENAGLHSPAERFSACANKTRPP